MTCSGVQRLTVAVGLRVSNVSLAWRPCAATAVDCERVVVASGEVEDGGDEWDVRNVQVAASVLDDLTRDEQRRLLLAVEEALVDAIESQTSAIE